MFFDTIHNTIKSRSITFIVVIHIDYIRNSEFVRKILINRILFDVNVSFVIHLLLFDCPLIIAPFGVVVKGSTVVRDISIPDGYANRSECLNHPLLNKNHITKREISFTSDENISPVLNSLWSVGKIK